MTTARQELAELLRQARTEAGLTQEALARRVRKDRTTISHTEAGELPSADLLADILRETGLTGYPEAATKALWRVARREAAPGQVHAEPWYEAEQRAHTLRFWNPVLIPGICQTERYAYEVFRSVGRTHQDAKDATAARIARQAILTRPDPPTVVIVVWEPVLTAHLIGTHEVMAEQMAKLAALPPSVLLHAYPAGACAGLGGPVSLASLPDGEVLLTGSLLEDMATREVAQVKVGSATFERVRAGALHQAGTLAVVEEAAKKIWTA